MKLKEIEHHLDPRIRERAIEYIQDGRITAPEPITSDMWRTTVHGTELYHVNVQLDGGKVNRWECSCPYDHGPICKHVAALLLLLKGKEVEGVELDRRTSTHLNTGNQSIDILLDEAPIEELRDFIRDHALTDKVLKNEVKVRFASHLDSSPTTTYKEVVRNHIRTARDRHGFIDYHSARHLIQSLNQLLYTADNLLARSKPLESLELCKILIEGVADALQQMDDSSGGASDILYGAFVNLDRIAEASTNSTKQNLFKWCIKEAPKQKYRDFSLDEHFLRLLPSMTIKDSESEFLNFVDEGIAREQRGPYAEYRTKSWISAKISFFEKAGRTQDAMDLIRKYAHNSTFRMMLVDRVIEEGDLDEAKSICREGLQLAKEQGHRGSEDLWKEHLFDLAHREEDSSEMIRLAEELFYANHYDMKWYRELKAVYERDSWAAKRDELIAAIEPNTFAFGHKLAEIYIEEGFNEKLLNLVQEQASDIRFTEQYGFRLMDLYPNEVLDAYGTGIVEHAKQTGRKHYRKVVYYLNQLRNHEGGANRARSLVFQFLVEYRNRPAMREELLRYFPEWIPH